MELVMYPDPILFQMADPITEDDELTPVFEEMLNHLKENKIYGGMALPQANVSKRGFLIRLKDYEQVILNPVIHRKSLLKTLPRLEQCLSIPGKKKRVRRATWVEVSYETLDGKTERRVFRGVEAKVFLHEYDHLDGKLIIEP